MKSRHFRFLTILGILSILAVAMLQFFWFKQAFDTQKKEFELKVFDALHEVAGEIFAFNGQTNQEYYPIEQLSENYYVVMINDRIDLNLLDDLLRREFREQYLTAAYYYTIYDCADDNLIYGSTLNSEFKESEKIVLPKWDQDQYYFGVYFPEVQSTIIKGMGTWFLLSAVLFLVLVFFGFSLIVIFRQKRFVEIQKDFVNNMTHELKTPLSSIKLTSEALMNNSALDEKSIKYLEIITHESQKLQGQIENILEQAKGEKVSLELKKQNVNLRSFISNIIERFNLSSTKLIKAEIEGDDTKVLIDSLHMEQVFHNLLDNVVKYGSQDPVLWINIDGNKNKARIIWRDNGEGIPGKYRKRIFNPFFRIIDKESAANKGFGLGLHYVKNVINAHKGSIRWVTSSGKGFFEIKLPAT